MITEGEAGEEKCRDAMVRCAETDRWSLEILSVRNRIKITFLAAAEIFEFARYTIQKATKNNVDVAHHKDSIFSESLVHQ